MSYSKSRASNTAHLFFPVIMILLGSRQRTAMPALCTILTADESCKAQEQAMSMATMYREIFKIVPYLYKITPDHSFRDRRR